MQLLELIRNAVINGDAGAAGRLVKEALDSGEDAETILRQGLIRAMGEVGELYETGEFFLPEMLVAGAAMKEALGALRPRLTGGGVRPTGRVALGTVQGDLHDIGKNLVGMMLEGAGFEVIDLGVDVAPAAFVEAVKREQVDLLGLSALLSTTVPAMSATLEALEAAGCRARVNVIVGGAAMTEEQARRIGADGFAPDAAAAARLATALVAARAQGPDDGALTRTQGPEDGTLGHTPDRRAEEAGA